MLVACVPRSARLERVRTAARSALLVVHRAEGNGAQHEVSADSLSTISLSSPVSPKGTTLL